jgi:CelD/BcsL family acetyltransferase involved in cellulose biosynthesis
MNTVRIVRFDRLTERELNYWDSLRSVNPRLDSPYFHPEFAHAVHESGRDVHVVVRDQGGEVDALLACHWERSLLRPVGWPAADFQGPVLKPDSSFAPLALLKGGVRGYAFDHLLEPCPDFEPWVESRRVSPYLDVVGGLEGYLGRASRSGKDNMAQARRRAAKAEQEYGHVRFVADSHDSSMLDRVVELKRAQYAATGVEDYFAEADRRLLLTRLLQTRGSSFGGILSTLHFGEHLAAAHFGMRAGNVLHWWFPVYDPDFGRFAPGWILLRELVQAAPALGITRIDLGRGEDEYKRRAKTGEASVCLGMVTRSVTRQTLRKMHHTAVDAAKSSSMGPSLRKLSRVVRGMKVSHEDH